MTPPKRVLILLYSQTGQLTEVVEQIIAPLQVDPAIEVHVQMLKPVKHFPYPWPSLYIVILVLIFSVSVNQLNY